MIRPELIELAYRWREALAGVVLALLGLWFAAGNGILPFVGGGMAAVGAALVWLSLQRHRFDRGVGEGPGVVSVDERRVTYMGPYDGGAIAVGELRRLDLDPTAFPHPVWVLVSPDTTLRVPVTALGADALLDLFAALPGLRTGRMLAELEGGGNAVVAIWERPDESARRRRLTLH